MEPGYIPQFLYPVVAARAAAPPPESQMNYKMLLQFLIGNPLIKKLTLNIYLLEQLQNTLLTTQKFLNQFLVFEIGGSE